MGVFEDSTVLHITGALDKKHEISLRLQPGPSLGGAIVTFKVVGNEMVICKVRNPVRGAIDCCLACCCCIPPSLTNLICLRTMKVCEWS